MWNERDEEIAINNIYKLIPLCCLLNQGTDIDPEIFWYSSFYLEMAVIMKTTSMVAFGVGQGMLLPPRL